MSSSMAARFSERVQGPVFPILTLFNADGSIDEQGIANYVEFLISQGAKNLMCTVGTSRYDVMTAKEMLRVNELVVKAAAGRAVVMVTTPSYGPTSQAIHFAQHAQQIGADAIIAVYPDRYYGDDHVFGFFEEVAASVNIGVMIHEMPIRAGRSTEGPAAQYSVALLARIFSIPNLVGLKEESGNAELIEHINTTYSNKAAVIGGRGGMNAYRLARTYGQRAYLVGIGNFDPKLELDFQQKLVDGQADKAEEITSNIEHPFFALAVKLGWHISLRAAMHLKGLCQPYERKPMRALDDTELESLKVLMQELELLGR